MAVSKDRTDWALLLLRVAVGGYSILHGLGPLMHARGSITIPNAARLGAALVEVAVGGLMVAGVWMLPASITLLVLMGWPIAHGLIHGGSVTSHASALLRFIATFASGLGGPGKWSPSD